MFYKTYEEWRSSVGFTDAQIAGALLQIAAERRRSGGAFRAEWFKRAALRLMKTHRLSTRVLGYALPILVAKCDWCDRKALTRKGSKGACREHKGKLLELGKAWTRLREEVTEANHVEKELAALEAWKKRRDGSRVAARYMKGGGRRA